MAKSSPDSRTKICTQDACGRFVRARGLCATHYNRIVMGERRHRKVEMTCEVCNTRVVRTVDARRRTTCSVACRTALQWGTVSEGGYNWAADAASRARQAGATVVELVEREFVLDRDGWRCYICAVDTSLATSPFDPSSATVDHVVALSRGGNHTASNMRCACLHCNSAKQDRAA